MEDTTTRYPNSRNYSWVAFLIIIGIVFLLNTTGVIGWGIWFYVVRYWPILIVLIGVRIILGNSTIAKILGMLVTIVLTVGAFGIAYVQFTEKKLPFVPEKINEWILNGGGGMFNLGQESVKESIKIENDEYQNVDSRSLKMDVGACTFNIVEDDTDRYISLDSEYPKSYEAPKLESNLENGRLNIDLTGASSKSFYLFYDETKYDISLGNTKLPTDFDIKVGAGSGNVVLESTPVNDFWGEVGAGKLDMDFSIDSVPSGDVRFTVGAGEMNINLPTRVGYVLEYDLGVGSITMNNNEISGVTGGKGKYTSANYTTSDIKVEIFVSVGVGSFNIDNI